MQSGSGSDTSSDCSMFPELGSGRPGGDSAGDGGSGPRLQFFCDVSPPSTPPNVGGREEVAEASRCPGADAGAEGGQSESLVKQQATSCGQESAGALNLIASRGEGGTSGAGEVAVGDASSRTVSVVDLSEEACLRPNTSTSPMEPPLHETSGSSRPEVNKNFLQLDAIMDVADEGLRLLSGEMGRLSIASIPGSCAPRIASGSPAPSSRRTASPANSQSPAGARHSSRLRTHRSPGDRSRYSTTYCY